MALRELKHPVRAVRRRLALPRWVRRVDDRVAQAINTRTVHPAVDHGYSRLSTWANHGKLWLLIAAVFLVLGRLRPALRGMASLGVASVVANLIGKRVFGGERPLLTAVPLRRQLLKSPTSPSFPSGHSASAAAFATGMALEWPRGGAVVAPVAAAVAYSRIHTGAHWFSDVVGGVALGAGVAAAGKLLVPAKRKHVLARKAAETSPRLAELPARPDGDGVFIVVNPAAGRGSGQGHAVRTLRRRLPQAGIHELADDDDLPTVVREALAGENPPTVLGACGGDGTVASVAAEARQAGLPLLVLPGGTFNHFAGTAGIGTIDDAIDAVQAGSGRIADVAELAIGGALPITVLNTASVGIYPLFVDEREKRERRLGKPLAALIAAVRAVTLSEPIDVSIDGRATRVWSIFVGVDRYYPATAAPLERRRLDDGVLDVRVLHAGRRARTRGAVALMFGRYLVAPHALMALTTDAITLAVRGGHDADVDVAHDGESTSPETASRGEYNAALRLLPGALQVYAPRPGS